MGDSNDPMTCFPEKYNGDNCCRLITGSLRYTEFNGKLQQQTWCYNTLLVTYVRLIFCGVWHARVWTQPAKHLL